MARFTFVFGIPTKLQRMRRYKNVVISFLKKNKVDPHKFVTRYKL